ncbi:MAG TPA: AAA family ATPase [Polyangiales bacterium]|nr:AAA family ATPase [Polyangiales bacterium]
MGEPQWVSVATLQVRVLGPLAVLRNGEAVHLPQSKKTRALLAYLAITGRAHRRDRLCSLLWDVADDPRGALRWSLSKIRPLVDSDAKRCLLADRENVQLDLDDASLDWRSVRRELGSGVAAIPSGRLLELASVFRGELLEGLDLLDFDEFTSWCAAEREHARKLHAQILQTLVEQLEETPTEALPHARELVRIDPLDEGARARLIRLLALAGRRNEAQAQYESAARMLKELGAAPTGPLVTAWREVDRTVATAGEDAAPVPEPTPAPEASLKQRGERLLVGRRDERARLLSLLDDAARGSLEIFLLKGESGVGKTRLLTELSDEARRRGCTVFEAAAYEAEAGRPYGPWIDALRRLPAQVITGADRPALAPLLPELGEADEDARSRDRLFGAVVDVIASQAGADKPVLLIFDDLHWCDDATAELLHYVARMSLSRPVLIVLGARDGELIDNESAMRLLRSFRRDGLIDEHLLLPLTEKEVAALVQDMDSAADPAEVFALSGGNALLARELAQAAMRKGESVPRSLKELVGDRLARLAPEAGDVLRWSAVLGPTFDVSRLTELVSLELDPLMNALTELERHALLESSSAATGTYAFHHALVHQVVYSEISEPRRKLMHLRIARLLRDRDDPDGTIALELAHHASVAGDAAMAARACVVAGNRCLRVFANAEAYTHARRGLRLVEELPDPERLKLRIELEQVSLGAHWAEDPQAEARRIEALAEQALDAGCAEHARLGFTLVSYLRWYEGAMGEAHRASLRAEFASRGADDQDRAIGIAEAGRCLVILERDLAQAEALLLEARALTERSGRSAWAVFDGVGLLRLHAGALEEARSAFEQAWACAKKEGNRLQEFMALEHLVTVCIHRHEEDKACDYARELAVIGEKLRDGSERPLGRAVLALCRYRKDEVDCRRALDDALQALREVDAKQRLAFVLTQAATIESERGELESAAARAREAAQLGEILQQPSETALARAVLLRIARERGDLEEMREQASKLAKLGGYANHVRSVVEREIAASGLSLGSDPSELGAR